MSDVKWIKIVTDIFDDEKILLIESMPERDAIIVIWFKLLCLAGKQNNGGVFMLSDRIAYTDEMLSVIFRRPVNTVRLALSTFEQFGMIEIVNNTITIPNWEKHQALELLEKNREKNRKKVAAFRERQRLLAQNDDVTTNVTVTGEVTLPNVTRTERERERDIEGDNIIIADKPQKKSPKRFTPPSVDEVRAYCQERQNNVDPERFVDYYNSNGWKVGRNAMKDWKAAVRTWEKNGLCGYGYGGKPQKPAQPAHSSIDMNEVAKLFNRFDD